MAEFERERAMPAPAEQVFAVAADVDRLNRWLPGTISVHPAEPPGLDVDVHDPDGDREAPGILAARRDQLRLEWGRRGSGDYTGWLQVSSAEQGRSYATLHLSFHGDQPANHGGHPAEEVAQRLDEALAKLADLVTAGA
ncbi:Polyketide cyclase / dehydrase and lipid transport [Amycolatopsis sacchari]|uniref:Polyketide cyclase / dehydrase and lipid transport n=1 Tax=Amycolatopsis sacchari TaxID=115433 RepID=A0A1I3R006_9PSEU|nr:SRPBCC family protein [Amycolatopsis sacchari]SFJ38871.1 Polyketide cyclase / dehydrase and lipid transport [Amycolatopsis sacchari]